MASIVHADTLHVCEPALLVQARAALDTDQRLTFNIDLAPAQPRNAGFVRASGTIPLRPQAQVASSAEKSRSGEGDTDCMRMPELPCKLARGPVLQSCLSHASIAQYQLWL